jgi:predicted nucleic acid-binding protein
LIVADSSAWIEFFNATGSWQGLRLQASLRAEWVIVGDLVLCEVLRGFREEGQALRAQAAMQKCELRRMVDFDVARDASSHCRYLRGRGFTIRKTIDLLIATFCLRSDLPLLHADRDFDVMHRELGLRVVAPS